MQHLDHVAKLVHRAKPIPARTVGLVRRKEDRRVTPIVDESRRTILSVKLEDRQQLDRRNSKLLKI